LLSSSWPAYDSAVARYRRNFVPGGTFFFTVNLANRNSRLLTERIELLRQAICYTKARHPFEIDAMVVLPEHVHALWTFPAGDADYALRWRLVKTFFSRGVDPVEWRSKSRAAKGERGLWQRRYWEHTIGDESDFERHCDDIHYNPVKHGHVSAASEWRYSSFQSFVKRGIYPVNWASGKEVNEAEFGER
jgi:putative transposase